MRNSTLLISVHGFAFLHFTTISLHLVCLNLFVWRVSAGLTNLLFMPPKSAVVEVNKRIR